MREADEDIGVLRDAQTQTVGCVAPAQTHVMSPPAAAAAAGAAAAPTPPAETLNVFAGRMGFDRTQAGSISKSARSGGKETSYDQLRKGSRIRRFNAMDRIAAAAAPLVVQKDDVAPLLAGWHANSMGAGREPTFDALQRSATRKRRKISHRVVIVSISFEFKDSWCQPYAYFRGEEGGW